MRPHPHYYKLYSDAMKQFQQTPHETADCVNSSAISKCYSEIWDTIFDFFTSSDYLNNCNPLFRKAKSKAEKDEILGKVFAIKPLDLELELFTILIHLIHKQLLSEKYENIRRLQQIIQIQRMIKRYIQHCRERDNLQIEKSN